MTLSQTPCEKSEESELSREQVLRPFPGLPKVNQVEPASNERRVGDFQLYAAVAEPFVLKPLNEALGHVGPGCGAAFGCEISAISE